MGFHDRPLAYEMQINYDTNLGMGLYLPQNKSLQITISMEGFIRGLFFVLACVPGREDMSESALDMDTAILGPLISYLK